MSQQLFDSHIWNEVTTRGRGCNEGIDSLGEMAYRMPIEDRSTAVMHVEPPFHRSSDGARNLCDSTRFLF